jgi:hypothetical protein
MKNLFLLSLLISSITFGQSFKELSRSEVREFSRAAEAVQNAMEESRFEQIKNFGPGILVKYASVQIQADGYAKDASGAYARTDSIVAYTVLRMLCDSLRKGINPSPTLDFKYSNLMNADKIHRTIQSNSLMKAFHPEYSDSMLQSSETYIAKNIPEFLAASKRIGRSDQALSLVNTLSFKPGITEDVRNDINSTILNAFYNAMGSNSVDQLEAFSKLYPDYQRLAVQERLSRIRGDEVAYLLRRGSKDDLIAFLVNQPTSIHAIDIKKRLRPILFDFALTSQDLMACQQFIAVFPEPSDERHKIEGLMNYLLLASRNQTDSTTLSNSQVK